MTFPVLDVLSSDGATLAVVALLGALVLVATWSAVTKLSPDDLLPSFGRHANRIFLPLRFRPKSGSGTVTSGFLTRLSMHSAGILTLEALAKGLRVELDPASLPGLAGGDSPLLAEISRCRSWGGEPMTYMVTVRFVDLSPVQRTSLSDFLGQLSTPNRLSPA